MRRDQLGPGVVHDLGHFRCTTHPKPSNMALVSVNEKGHMSIRERFCPHVKVFGFNTLRLCKREYVSNRWEGAKVTYFSSTSYCCSIFQNGSREFTTLSVKHTIVCESVVSFHTSMVKLTPSSLEVPPCRLSYKYLYHINASQFNNENPQTSLQRTI